MRPLAGFVIKVNKDVVTIKLESGNKVTCTTKGKFTYGDEVRVNFNFKTNKARSISLVHTTPKDTQICSRCSESILTLKQGETVDNSTRSEE